MNALLSILGTAMLILIGLAVVLAIVLLILYEARCIVRLSAQLSHSTAVADKTCDRSNPVHDERGRS